MEGKRLVSSLRLRNLLSFGSDGLETELQPLNVLIGPNTSGKSNFIHAIRLLRSAASTFPGPMTRGGGVGEWLWKGDDPNPIAEIGATVEYPEQILPVIPHERDVLRESTPLQYRLSFTMSGLRLQIESEYIRVGFAQEQGGLGYGSLYSFESGETRMAPSRTLEVRESGIEISPGKPFLSRVRDPIGHPEITYLGDALQSIKVFGNMDVSARSVIRMPQPTDLPGEFLEEDGSNLALVLNHLQYDGRELEILKNLRELYRDAVEIQTPVFGGSIQTVIRQEGLGAPISVQRLSDGTLRYLCLLTILCHPSPPPLVCIEEPELGMHPDIIHHIAELIVEASRRTQLIVTTHSDILVSALSDTPDAVLVCERNKNGTHLRRLELDRLKEWLEDYTLDELWRMGEIGGN